MLVAVFGDTHGNLLPMYKKALEFQERTGHELDLLIQIGDFGFWLDDSGVDLMTTRHAEKAGTNPSGDYPRFVAGEEEVPIPTLVIRGNHEDQEYLMAKERQLMEERPHDHLYHAIEMVPNMFYLPDGHIWNFEGIRFAGLGGNYSSKTWANWDYWHPHREIPQRYGEKRRLNHFTRDRWERLMREKFDVLLTHDAPTGCGLASNSSIQLPEDEMAGGQGVPHLRELIDTVKPRYAFHGHWHQYRKNQFGETTSIVLDKVTLTPNQYCMEIVEL